MKYISSLVVILATLVGQTVLACTFAYFIPPYPEDADQGVPTNPLILGYDQCARLLDANGNEVEIESVEDLPFRVFGAFRPVQELAANVRYELECSNHRIAFTTGDGPDLAPPAAVVDAHGTTQVEFPADTSFGNSCGDNNPEATVSFALPQDDVTPSQQLRIVPQRHGYLGQPLNWQEADGRASVEVAQDNWTAAIAIMDGAGNIGPVTEVQLDWDGGCDCSSTSSQQTRGLALVVLGVCWVGRCRRRS